MSEFLSTLKASGFVLDHVIADGKWHRVKTVDKPHHRNGAYLLRADGLLGFFKNWATDIEHSSWRSDKEVLPAQRRISDQALAQARQRAAAHTAKCVQAMRKRWASLPPLQGPHPYLSGKGLDMRGTQGLRIDSNALVVPIFRAGRLMSLQSISPSGDKRFSTGCPVKYGAHVLERSKAVLTCFAEGFATGLALYQAIPQARVIVCFNAANLVEVAQRFQGLGLGVVCADNDHETQARTSTNPGIDAGRKAAELLGCGLCYPQGLQGSDFADAIAEKGIDAHRWIARTCVTSAKPFRTQHHHN